MTIATRAPGRFGLEVSRLKNSRCLNPASPSYGTVGSRSIIHNGFYRTRSGKRRRYRCGECGKTFSSTKGTPYYRLQHRRATFDGVIALRVEGVSISSISRIKGIAWNTVARWLEKAGCLRCLLLVMCTHPFAKKGLTLHLARSEGREPYLGGNLMHRKVLASSHQHLMAEAPVYFKRAEFWHRTGC